jgi:DNA-binding Lrp family transcriptional regulator
VTSLSPLERAIINRYQHGFPQVPRPFAVIADATGCSESEALATVRGLAERGILQRIGAVVRSGSIGCSTLAAMRVPADRLEDVAAAVSEFPEVNHNYERESDINLWFVVTAPDEARLQAVLDEIGSVTGIAPLDLRLVEAYHIDLGFRL